MKPKTKKCPSYKFFFLPVLNALEQMGGSGSNEEIYKKVLDIVKLPESVIDEMHSFTQTEASYQIAWAKTYLKNYGAVDTSKRGVWTLTAKGKEIVAKGTLDTKDVVRTVNGRDPKPASSTKTDTRPMPSSTGWRSRVEQLLSSMNPYAFETLCQRLLRECGFTDVVVTQKSGDGGIDGEGKLRIQGIFSFNVAFQCKRYKGAVGAPQVRDFRGSLSTNVEKGVLITTGFFTQKAIEEATAPGKRIIDLMDGEEFISKLAEYRIGLNEVPTYEVDETFFKNLDDNS